MGFSEIMQDLAKMYGTYDATCWLNKPRKDLDGKSAAEAIKEGKLVQVHDILKKESKYKKIKK